MIYFDGAGRYCPQWWGRHDHGHVRWLLTLRLQWWGRHGSGHELWVHNQEVEYDECSTDFPLFWFLLIPDFRPMGWHCPSSG